MVAWLAYPLLQRILNSASSAGGSAALLGIAVLVCAAQSVPLIQATPSSTDSLYHAPPMYFGMFELGAISAALALRLSTAVNKDPESGCARWQGMGADTMVLCWLLVAVLLSVHSILSAEPDHVTEGNVGSFLKTYAVFPVIAAVFMFCGTANTGYAVAMLKHPVISRLGDYSFAVYLWQAALELGPLWPCQALAILRNCTLTRSLVLAGVHLPTDGKVVWLR